MRGGSVTLKRKTPLKRTPFVRKTPFNSGRAIRPKSRKRLAEGREYANLRAKLVLHPSARCVVCWEQNGQEHRPVDLHHRREMGMGGAYTNPSNVIPVCRNPCHEWIHSHPQEARELGFLVFEGDPEWTDLGARAWRNR